jgi:LemA protein
MSGAVVVLLVFGGVAIVGVLWFVGTYNGLVQAKNKVLEAWAQIDKELKRRYDLIPNLIETVKGYMKHEASLLEGIARARAGLVSTDRAQVAAADAQVSAGLRQLWAVAENYPDLKANQNFLKLQDELVRTENQIAMMRQGYNETVRRYNDRTMMIPSNIVAGMFNFRQAEFFTVDSPEERKAVKVQF